MLAVLSRPSLSAMEAAVRDLLPKEKQELFSLEMQALGLGMNYLSQEMQDLELGMNYLSQES